MPWNQYAGPSTTERVVCAACYLTGGIAGILYIIITRSQRQSDFFQFHFLQAVILAILSMLISFALSALAGLLGPLIGLVAGLLPESMRMMGGGGIGLLIMTFNTLYGLLFVYGLIFALLGKYCEIPLISNIVRDRMH
ncbi:MAG: hypothetical protein K2X81_15875 [Candidatus Obscuribacterales bacterium]|nr:hypothetical protein [Candidatus Obscuribacterales bacterium]